MIDEKRLIEVMLKSREREHGPVASLIDWFIQVVEACPKVGEWIPCSERLPEDFEKVLTCDELGNMHVMGHHKIFEYPFGIHPNDSRYYTPIAWMPLPDAYKGE